MGFNIVKLLYKSVFDVLKYLEVTITREKGNIANISFDEITCNVQNDMSHTTQSKSNN